MKRSSKIIRTSLGLSILAALVTVGIALATIVSADTFADGFQRLEVDQGSTTSADFDSGSMIGGERDTQLTWNSGTGGAVDLYIDSDNSNFLSFAQASGYTSNALLQWDGFDSSMTLNATGLSSRDLTDSGSNNGFRIRIIDNDNPVDITIRVYTDAANWSTLTQNTPGDVNTGQIVDTIFSFGLFTTGGGSGATFSNVGAVEMIIDGTRIAGADVSFNLFESTPDKEYGDLPSTYGSSINDAYQIPLGLRLGDNVDVENTPKISANADGDDEDGASDEDGVSRRLTDFWTNGATVRLIFSAIRGCEYSDCYINGWIDWNGDGDFNDLSEHIYDELTTPNRTLPWGTSATQFTVPGSSIYTVGNPVFARFRICEFEDQCDTPTATNISNGEIEDYLWNFGPTAVSLETFEVHTVQATNWLTFAVIGGATIILGASTWIMHRRKTH